MALQYFLYNTNFGNTVVNVSGNTFSPSPPYAEILIDFSIPEIQPFYLYANSGGTGGTIIVNTQANIDAYLNSIAPTPTADDNVTYGEFTGVTQALNTKLAITTFSGYTGITKGQIDSKLAITTFSGYTGTTKGQIDSKLAITTFSGYTGTTKGQIDSKLAISIFTGYTATTGLQQVTQINAQTNIESTFNGGLRTHKIRPTGDTTTAIQINKANGTTHIINVDTVSGFTGFGTVAPLNKVHLYGTDISASSEYSVQTNGLTLDGVLGADKEIVWANNGVPKWQAQTYRGENDVFWYLVNTQGQSNPLTIMETGRVGINKQTNFLDYHTAEIVGNGLNDLIVSGNYTQNYNSVYEVEIVTPSGATDEWRWRVSIDGGTTYSLWSGNILVNYSPYELQFGVYLSFENLTGHTVGNVFRFTAFTQIPQATLSIAPMGIKEVQHTNNYYANPIIYLDETANANGGLVDNVFIIFDAGTGATIQAFYWGTTVKINSIFFNLATFGTNLTLVAEYWNTDIQDWTVLDDVIHGYADGTANLSKSGRIIWNPRDMSGWNKSFLPGLSGDTFNIYWIRIITTTPAGIAPVGRSLSIGNDKRLSVYSAFNDYRPQFYIDSIGRVNIGGGTITSCNQLQVNTAEGLSIASVAGSDSLVEFDGDDSCISTLKLKTASNNACGTTLDFSRTRGTLNVPLSMQTNDLIGNIVFKGRVGASGSISSKISSQYVGDGTTRCADLIFSTACGSCTAVATEKVRIRYNGNTGFGLSGATATIHIKAGSTSVAPLKFTSGSLLSAPQAGAVEFLDNAWYGTTTGLTRQTFAFLDSPVFTGTIVLPSGTTFPQGFATSKIRPLVDSTTAIQITKANNITPLVNFDTISGLTGFGTIAPQAQIHVYGTDTSEGLPNYGIQKNGLILDGVVGTDKAINWFENGVPHWEATTYRCEDGVFWYLANMKSQSSPITVMETGRVGINKRTNFMESHAAEINGSGLNDLVVSGIYTQNYNSIYEVEIASTTGATDTWKWRVSIDDGNTYSNYSPVSACTTGATFIQYGVYLSFNNLTGHTTGNIFRFIAFTQIPQATFSISPMEVREVQITNNYNANPIVYTDLTAIANGGLQSTTFNIFTTGTGSTQQAFYWGTPVQIHAMYFNLVTGGAGMTIVTEYWNTNTHAWVALGTPNNYLDSTNNLSVSGNIFWTPATMTNWNTGYIPNLSGSGLQLYWMRIRTTSNNNTTVVAKNITIGVGDKRLSVYAGFSDYIPSMYVDTLGRMSIGGGNITGKNILQVSCKKTLASAITTQSLVEIDSEDSGASDLKIKLDSNDTCSGGLVLVKTRGTLEVPTDTQIGDSVGHIDFRGRNSGGAALLSKIEAKYTGFNTGTFGDLMFSTACNSILSEKVRITGSGTTGFGVVTPTAIVHLKAGTSTIAPLKFNSGILLGTTQAGAVEYNGNAWYGTLDSCTRNTFAFLQSPQFSGAPELPVNTTLIGTSLCNLIWYSGGTNNTCLVKTCSFNAYTASTHSITTKGITGATNGLTKYGCHDVCLGGTLSSALVLGGNQDICLQGKRVDIASSCGAQIYDKNGCGIEFYSSGGTTTIKGLTSGGTESMRFQISDVQATFTDSRALPRGVEYNGDYSNTYNAHSLVDKAYVDSVASGLIVKASVWVATTGSITLSGLTTIDGIALANGNRVLVKNQSTGSLNGIYVATGTTWQRASDYNFEPSGEISNGNLIPITTGNTNGNTIWVLTTLDPIVSGDTLTFSLFSKTSAVIAGNGICVTQVGGNYDVSTKLANNCGLCVDASGLYVNPNIAGTGLNYSTGVLSVCGSALAGNSLSWTGTQFAVNISGGTLSTALSNKLDKSIYQTYTGTTAPGQFASKSFLSTYTGTTAPATFASKSFLSTYTGTTVPNTYETISHFDAYSAATKIVIDCKANIASPTFTGTVRSVTPAANDNGTCIATTAWYYGQCASATPNMDSGSGTVGTSACWAHSDHVHPSDTSRLSTSAFSTYTGTTAPAQFASKSFLSTYTGTTAPATYATIANLALKAYLSGATFTGVVNVCKPAQNDNTTCAATTSWYISQGGTANPLMDGIVTCGISNLFARQDHVHPRDTSKLSLSGGTMTGTLNGTIMCASSCLCSPITIGTTCVCSPVGLFSTSSCSPIHCGACGYFSTAVCSPLITGSTKVCSPIICGTSCVTSPKFIENGTCLGSTYYPFNQTITGRSTTTTVDATYANKIIEANGTFTITFPNSMATGMMVDVINVGTGTITLAASTTINAKGGNLKIATCWAGASVYHRGSNVWVAVGDLTP